MPKAIKYYTDEELDKKIKELNDLKSQREKERQELLDLAKITVMNSIIDSNKNDATFAQNMNKMINSMLEKLTSRKDKKIKKALEEFLKLFPIAN